MTQQKTHRVVKNPQISARYLADYMAASESAKRTIVRGCKYQPLARLIQHNEAKSIVAKYIRGGKTDPAKLVGAAEALRHRLADSEFDRDLFDHNADYIERFSEVVPDLSLPQAEIEAPGQVTPIVLNNVKVTVEVHFRLSRVTKTNKVRVGAGMLRYAKGKPLPLATAEWQSAFFFGYLSRIGVEDEAEPEQKLCVTVDAQAGECFPAPTDSVRRFTNMEAACASIAERWPNIEPPSNAVF